MACSKDCKKLGLAAAASFVALSVMEFVVHGVLLSGVYQRPHYMAIWNPEAVMASRRWAMFLAHLIAAVAFAKIYTHGYEMDKPPVGQGLRYGLMAGLMVSSMHSLIGYMVYPISCKLAGAWLIGGTVEFAVLGVIVALLYRPAPHTS